MIKSSSDATLMGLFDQMANRLCDLSDNIRANTEFIIKSIGRDD